MLPSLTRMRFRAVVAPAALCSLVFFVSNALAAGPLTSGRVVGGNILSPTFTETWTFNGAQGDRVLFSAPSNALPLDTRMVLRDPGSLIVASTDFDRLEAVLPFSGTFTLVVEDVGLNNTGTYNLGFVNLTAGPLTSPTDPDGGVLASAEPRAATANAKGDFDVFTFTGTAGDRVLIGGASSIIGPAMSLYPPGGGGALATSVSRVDRQLTATGTYQIVVEDQNFDQTGAYTVIMIDLTTGPLNSAGDTDGGLIVSGENKTGGLQTVGDFDVFTFNGSAGERVLLAGVLSTGSPNTRVSVYPPGGGDPLASSTADRVDVQLTLAGSYQVVVEDAGLLATGNYRLSLLNVTSGPLTAAGDPHGGPISSGQFGTGSIESRADFDAYTFFGNAGDRVVVGAVRTTGINVEAYVYPPNGGPAEALSSAAPRLEFVLASTGTHTIVIQDRDLALTGGYNVSVLNLATGPFRSTSETDSATIVSAEYKTTQIQAATDLDVFRFPASAGDRIILNVIPTFTTGFATQFYLYPPGGGPALVVTPDRTAMTLATTGTYTLLVEDVGLDRGGTYVVSLLNVTQGPFVTPTDPDGGPIASAEIASAAIQAPGDFDAFTFSGSAGQQVIIVGVATAGTLAPMLSLYPPTGASPAINTTAHRFDVQLPEDGTYTLILENLGPSGSGAYHVSILNLATGPFGTPQDPEGGSIASAEVKTGVSHDPADLDVFTFAGTAGDRVVIAAAPALDDLYDPQFRLYPPGGDASAEGLGLDRLDQRLEVTGIYTIVIEDQGLDSPGTYSLSLLNVTAGPLTSASDPDGGPIESAQTRAGQMNSSDDLDAFTFTGSAGDRVVIGAVSTTGEPFHTIVRIYPPAGGEAEAYSVDRLDAALAATGTYTLVVEDLGLDATGNYVVSLLNVTAGPLAEAGETEGGPIGSAESRTGTISTVGDMDAYTFTGSNGQLVVCSGASTSGALSTRLYLYPPGGGAALVATEGNRFVAPLVGSGTFTLVVEDSGLDALGDYSMTLVNLATGPFATIDDPEGGPIVSGQSIAGVLQTAIDFDVFSFSGNAGDRVVIGAVATGATGMNPQIYLYAPSGGSPLTFTSGHRLDQQLPTSGPYALIVEDQGVDQDGDYGLTLLNLSAGPLTSPTDPDGGLVGPGESRDAEIAPVPDLDGYWFFLTAGTPVDLSAVATHGTLNTNLSVYPPNGGPLIVYTESDQVMFWPPVPGRYCLVVEDVGLDDGGTYHLTLDDTGIADAPGDAFDRTRVVMMAPTPNPSPRTTTLAFTLPDPRRVQLRLYDVTGSLVRTLADGSLEAGPHSYAWDGTNERGTAVRSGIYYAELSAGNEVQRRKLVRIR